MASPSSSGILPAICSNLRREITYSRTRPFLRRSPLPLLFLSGEPVVSQMGSALKPFLRRKISLDLPGDRARVPTQLFCNVSYGPFLPEASLDGFSLLYAEVFIWHTPGFYQVLPLLVELTISGTTPQSLIFTPSIASFLAGRVVYSFFGA